MEHCEWQQVRQEAQDEEHRSLQVAAMFLMFIVFALGCGVGAALHRWWIA